MLAAASRPFAEISTGLDVDAVLGDPQRLAMVPPRTPGGWRTMNQLAGVAAATLRSDYAAISLFTREERHVLGEHSPDAFRWPSGPGLCGFTLALGEPLLIGDLATDCIAALHRVDGPSMRAYAAAPVRLSGERVGTLCALRRRPVAWTISDARRLVELADLAEHLLACEIADDA